MRECIQNHPFLVSKEHMYKVQITLHLHFEYLSVILRRKLILHSFSRHRFGPCCLQKEKARKEWTAGNVKKRRSLGINREEVHFSPLRFSNYSPTSTSRGTFFMKTEKEKDFQLLRVRHFLWPFQHCLQKTKTRPKWRRTISCTILHKVKTFLKRATEIWTAENNISSFHSLQGTKFIAGKKK